MNITFSLPCNLSQLVRRPSLTRSFCGILLQPYLSSQMLCHYWSAVMQSSESGEEQRFSYFIAVALQREPNLSMDNVFMK